MQLLWLAQNGCTDSTLVGGKAAMLARLTPRYRVPPGFCIVFNRAGEPLSSGLRQEIRIAYEQLLATAPIGSGGVAVRSSAVDEDGLTTSFAGLHETVLGVTTLPDLMAAIERCVASARSTQALAYRQQHGLSAVEISFAVLVQQMVDAEASAVAFSVDPVSGERERLVINATWGLGNVLVGGQITPDSFVINRRDWTIVERQVADKAWMTRVSFPGLASIPVVTDQRTVPSLSDERVKEVAQMVLQLETELGWPVDVECAYAAGKLYLLQCRPITTLAVKAAPSTDDAWIVEWDQPEDAEQTWMGGREFVLLLQQSLSLFYYQGWAKAFRAMDVDGGLRARFVNGYEYRLWQWTPRQSFEITQAAQRQREQDTPRLWATEWLPVIKADLQGWNGVVLADLPADELARHLQALLTRQLEHWAIHAVMGDAPLSAVGRLVDWYLQRFPAVPESEPYQLVQGQPNTSTEANHELWRLGRLAKHLKLVDVLTGHGNQEDLPDEFTVAFTDYCQRYGQLTTEQQQRTLHLIQTYAALNIPDPNLELRRLAEERDTFTISVRAKHAVEERQEFDALLACALANNPLTESHNLYLDQMSDAATKRVIAEFARRLHTLGVLLAEDDIAYLSVYELLQWGYGLGNPLRPLITARKAEYARYRRLTPPLFIGKAPSASGGGDGVDRFGGPTTPMASEEGTIRGIGASPGVVRGRALVVKSLAAAVALQPGDILVCRSTDPTWTPLFAIAGGLVTDFGGSLSHAAVVAREYRLPAVVGTHVATQQIVTGQWVEVDGLNGIVRLR